MKMGREAVPVDGDSLDTEWKNLPEQVLQASEDEADAEAVYLTRKARMEVKKSQLFLDVIAYPAKYKIVKTTEKVVDAVVAASEDIREYNEKVLTAKRDWEGKKNVVYALVDKRRSLENLVSLHGLGYAGQPRDKTGGAKSYLREKAHERKPKIVLRKE